MQGAPALGTFLGSAASDRFQAAAVSTTRAEQVGGYRLRPSSSSTASTGPFRLRISAVTLSKESGLLVHPGQLTSDSAPLGWAVAGPCPSRGNLLVSKTEVAGGRAEVSGKEVAPKNEGREGTRSDRTGSFACPTTWSENWRGDSPLAPRMSSRAAWLSELASTGTLPPNGPCESTHAWETLREHAPRRRGEPRKRQGGRQRPILRSHRIRASAVARGVVPALDFRKHLGPQRGDTWVARVSIPGDCSTDQ